jgi:hypothetical protein
MNDAAAIIIAAKGPKTAAAKTVGRSEIDASTRGTIRIRPLSATAAVAARPMTTGRLPNDHRCSAHTATSVAELTARAP